VMNNRVTKIVAKRKKKYTECGKSEAKQHTDNGLNCGEDLCDICFEKMVNDCRTKSW